MNSHRHLTPEEVLERADESSLNAEFGACPVCAAEIASLSGFLSQLKAVDVESVETTEWDDLVLRQRIRAAVAQEPAYARSFFDRFAILRPAFVSALLAVAAVLVWSPFASQGPSGSQVASIAVGSSDRLPAWSPLPDESEDEGLAVLAEWTPNDDELQIARCRAACLAGLTSHEEENLLQAISVTKPPPAALASSPTNPL